MASTDEFPVPMEWYERAVRYLGGGLEVVPARPAATVVLLRDTPSGPQVYLIKRAVSMAFAGGRYAFPGGRIDPGDLLPVPWAGPDAAYWAGRFGMEVPEAHALVCGAVRETFEETGVLFAGPGRAGGAGEPGGTDERVGAGEPGDAAVPRDLGDVSGSDWERERHRIESRQTTLAAVLESRGLRLRADLLGAWSRWVTPEFEERRYDTAFFVAALPAGQIARDVSGETETTVWATPAQALADYERGDVLMLPPTLTTLRQLLPYASAAEAVRASRQRSLEPVRADVRLREDGIAALVWSI